MTNFPLAVILQGVDKLTPVLVKGGNGLAGFAQKANKLGSSLTAAVTLPVLGLAAAVVHTGLEWDRGWREVGATLDATADDMARMKAAARATSDDLGGASGALQVIRGLVREGGSLNDVLTQTPAALNLVKIMGGDLSEGMSMLSDTMAATGANVGQTGRFIDVLVNATGGSPKRLRDFSAALQTAGLAAQPLGVQFEDLVTVLGALETRGIEAGRAGGLMGVMFSRIQQPGQAAIDVLDRLAIRRADVFASDGKLRDFIGLLELLQSRGATARDFGTIFGTKAGPQLANLLGEGIAGMRDYRASLELVGMAEQKAERMTTGAAGGYEKFTAGLKTLSIAIGESGLLEWLAQGTTRLANWMRNLSETNPELLRLGTMALGAAAALGPLLKLLAGVAGVLGKILTLIDKVGAGAASLLGQSGLTKFLGAAGAGNLLALQGWMKETSKPDFVTNFEKSNPFLGQIAADASGNIDDPARRQALEEWRNSAPWYRRLFLGNLGQGGELDRRAQEIRSQTEIKVRFENAPAGTRARVEGDDTANVSLNVGYALGY